MSGKKIIFIVVIAIVVVLVATWIYAQKIMNDLDREREIESTSMISVHQNDIIL